MNRNIGVDIIGIVQKICCRPHVTGIFIAKVIGKGLSGQRMLYVGIIHYYTAGSFISIVELSVYYGRMPQHLLGTEAYIRVILFVCRDSLRFGLRSAENKRFNIKPVTDARLIKEIPPHCIHGATPFTQPRQINYGALIRVVLRKIDRHGALGRSSGDTAGTREEACFDRLIRVRGRILIGENGIFTVVGRKRYRTL